MKFQEILKRLTGLSSPVFGVSWNPENTSRDIARRTILFLEDRRVLYNPSEMEDPRHCVISILEIRKFLTNQIPDTADEKLQEPLKALRIACRKFLDSVGAEENRIPFGNHRASRTFNSAIGELRGVFGVHIAKIAAMYGLDVEDNLASILPDSEDKERTEHMG